MMPIKIHQIALPNKAVLEVCQGDLTEEKVDTIVNAANECLLHGGGIAGAISRKGGKTIQEESSRWVKENGPVSHSKPAIISAGNLPCRSIIHAVGPIWGSGNEDEKLNQAIQGSLTLADEKSFSSIAFPAISTGIFGFPKIRAASIFYTSIWEYFEGHPTSTIRLVRIVLFDNETLEAFFSAFQDWHTMQEKGA